MADVVVDKIALTPALRMAVPVSGYQRPQAYIPVQLGAPRTGLGVKLCISLGPFFGSGRIEGTVKTAGRRGRYPAWRRVVLVEERTGAAVAQTWSNKTTGAYVFPNLATGYSYTVLAFDHEGVFDAALASGVEATA